MQSLNSLSTFGTHPKEFDPEQVRPVLNNLTTIIKWYLKYKDSQAISKPVTVETKDETKSSDDSSKQIQKSKKKLIILISGLTLVIAIVVAALFIFNIIGKKERTEDLTKLEKSIAVLPFENLSSDVEQAWFSDGITDVIINQLSKISDLRVLGRTSTLKYKEIEEKKSISEIGEELGVNFIIEGTVQRQENKMRISVQLIRALNEGHIWSDIYDREWKDIFDVQSDIAKRIAEELKTVMTYDDRERIVKTDTKNPEAYNLYLQGRFFWNKRTEEGLEKSVEYFQKALAADPDYALAYAGLADAYSIQAWWEWRPMKEGYAKAKEMALKALEIDENLAEAHATLGTILCYSEWNWEEARKELVYAIKLDPNYLIGHSYYSELLDILGQNEEARVQIDLALELDPFFPLMHSLSAIYFYHEGKFKESLEECRKVKELDPDNISAHQMTFYIYIRMGEDLKAVEELQKIIPKDTLTTKHVTAVKEVYNKSGIKGLLSWLIELELKNPKPSSLNLAKWYTMLDKRKEAIDWLEKALEQNLPNTLRINNDPDFDTLRSEPGFVELIEKIGLSNYSKRD